MPPAPPAPGFIWAICCAICDAAGRVLVWGVVKMGWMMDDGDVGGGRGRAGEVT